MKIKRPTGVVMLCAVAITAVSVGSSLAAMTYTAVCEKPHGLSGDSYWGPNRTTEGEAQADCDQHAEEWPGHSCSVFGRDL